MLLAECTHPIDDTVRCVQLDPLEKVFTEESYFVENTDTAVVAKGETATFQFVLKSVFPIRDLKIEAGNLVNGNRQIAATLKAFVGYVRSGVHTVTHSKDAVFPVSDYYPDCLQDVESMDVPSMQNQPVWVSYVIPRDAVDGNYSAILVFTGKVNGKPLKITKQVNIKVYPVTLPEQTLWVTNWFNVKDLSKMNGNKPVEPHSDRHWELLTELAHIMRDHGQNTYIIGLNRLCNIECTGTQYSFDFSNFDKTVELLIREGGLKRIEGGHLANRMGDRGSDFGVYVPIVGKKPIDDVMAQNYLSQFLPALYSHLEAKGWTDMYIQHIADEPFSGHAYTYSRIAEYVRKYMPGIPILDAIKTYQLVNNSIDIWVPLLDIYHDFYEFFQERQAAGDEIWMYTCIDPQGNYANRFLEQPLIQTRFLHWINYRYGATGYLHWGFNWWLTDVPVDFSSSGYPGGDCWIVYPANGKVYSSIRLAAMRDGIADYELLKLLEQKAPQKAKELAGKVIYNFNSYNNNISAFRKTRLELLKSLSE
jgi:hypothetical protein